MAKVYLPPARFGDSPDLGDFLKDHDFEGYNRACEAWIERIADAYKAANPHDPLVGEEVGFPVGDGYARYLIARTKPFQLIWLKVGDAWSVPTYVTRGFTLADARAQVRGRRGLRAIFEGRK